MPTHSAYRPIEASVVLLPIYEFLLPNPTFSSVLIEELSLPLPEDTVQSGPLPCTIISFASYLCTHASSTDSQRSIAYASLSLNVLLAFVESDLMMDILCRKNSPAIRLCRQVCNYLYICLYLRLNIIFKRLPALPQPLQEQPLACSILDCCVIWLRHNLQRRLEVNSHTYVDSKAVSCGLF